MRYQDRYVQACNHIYSSIPCIGRVAFSLPTIPIPVRKSILAFTRTQPPVLLGSRFYSKYETELLQPAFVNYIHDHSSAPPLPTPYQTTVLDLLEEILQATRCSPTTMALLSSLVRQAPYQDEDTIQEELQNTIDKELDAILGTTYNAPLNYGLWFDDITISQASEQALFDNVPGDIETTTLIRYIFKQSKTRLRDLTLFPAIKRKTIGVEATKDFKNTPGIEGFEEQKAISLLDVERVYHRQGIAADGDVEVRSAFKFTDLKPRIYYAQGPTSYHASKYIQPIINIILDQFTFVHRKHRFNEPPDSVVYDKDTLFIYDYASFTSKLKELPRFLEHIGRFYLDTPCVIVDSFTGPRHTTIGRIILDYAEVCSSLHFDISRIAPSSTSEPIIYVANTGLLGVPGNIGFSTLLHGLHLAMVCGFSRVRCIGDDARGKRSNDHVKSEFVFQLNNLGEVADKKAEEWSAEDAKDPESVSRNYGSYEKRPFFRDTTKIAVKGKLYVIPDLTCVYSLARDSFHTGQSDDLERQARTALKQWRRLLDSIHLARLSEVDRDVLTMLQTAIKRMVRRISPNTLGGSQLHVGSFFVGFVPPYLGRHEFGEDWRDLALSRLTGQDWIVRRPWYYDQEQFFLVDESVEVASSPLIRWLEAMEYVEVENLFDVVDRYELLALDRATFDALIDSSYVPLIRVTCIAEVPIWVKTVYAGFR